jgi:hypothetical protein
VAAAPLRGGLTQALDGFWRLTMAKVLFHTETTYESTSDEWKEHEHKKSYYLDNRTGKITCRTVTEFQDTRSGTNTITSDETVEIELSKLSKALKKKLSEL